MAEPANEDPATAAFAGSKPEDWMYIAEGALNLATRYAGDDDRLRGCVLRVRKDNPEASGGKSGESNPWRESMQFLDRVILPLLGRRYVQPAVEVPLPQGYIEALGAHIEPSRPEKRRKHTLDMGLKTGLLMLDNTAIPTGEGPSICFELKVKCGFIPETCPFITHDIKRKVDRFTMHQALKNEKGKLDTLSKYNPTDLFSYDRDRVLQALDALVDTPQNNFRMFVDGKMVFPDSKGHGSRADLAEILQDYPALKDGGVDGLLAALANILVQEPLLRRLQRMQEMDDCDIEAAWPIYQEILARGETVQPLAEGDSILPRAPPATLPKEPAAQHDLVRRFLLSCTAKDCSTMIVLKPSAGNKEPENVPTSPDLPVTDDKVSRTIVDGVGPFMYSIAIVDLDPKPIEKMEHWFTLDKKIAEFYAAKMATPEKDDASAPLAQGPGSS
ncbi:Inositol-pentakisphosphate 2-kinase [Hondaea fermentalgiana]|uniref:Inositol-pentakisphosphate 2-kinase n=1 Tax=Hondaea fermentalgiana TaxID=2315210 RepID=A0A2R5GDY9_9STRA|nr:Inositol-pentakisphosphate 2-kinase [Hondaea fermentalgiana]|eukprot:GBG29152.1 Inositol-pentakisphosphate 2-kinase [Hondaea fermentalgiana]